ncbi:MAG: hypothetical protein WDN00_15565 [Limisphaerales bacterium]
MEQKSIPGFRSVPRTGVIYVTHEATRHGFAYGKPDWANLGQGSPETGDISDAPPRITEVTISEASRQYGRWSAIKNCARPSPIFTTPLTGAARNRNTPPRMSASPAADAWR